MVVLAHLPGGHGYHDGRYRTGGFCSAGTVAGALGLSEVAVRWQDGSGQLAGVGG